MQYGESDLAFLNRLCEEEGLHYHHEHRRDGHVLVFGDDATGFPRLAATRYLPGNGLVADELVIRRFDVGLQTRSSATTLRDHDFRQPRLRLENQADAATPPVLEHYGFPGHFTDRETGKRLSGRRLESLRVDAHQAQGASDQPSLVSGHFLPLEHHPRGDWNQLWLLTEIHHQGRQPQVLEESITSADSSQPDDGFRQGYRNTFTAIPWSIPFRLPLRHPKPRLLGAQSAVVTGPAGEEIHCDALGRIKVQFHWDREGQADERTSCWLRVASGWAGNDYGALAVPRIGMEVLVGFLEGDPDQPLVTGCFYHAEHRPPLELPKDKTRSSFKSLSSPGGGGYNELRMEDRQGQEEIHIHAQRDWDERIRHDHRSEIGHERHQRIRANSYSELHAEEHRITHGERRTEVRADDHLSIAESQHLRLATGLFVEAGREIRLQSGQKIVLEAGARLTLKAGGSFVQLDAGGITLVGADIRVNPDTVGPKSSSSGPEAPMAPNTVKVEDQESDFNSLVIGQLTYDAEGNDDPGSRFFSRVLHWPGNANSGVTLGRGYDMGSRTEADIRRDLEAAGIPNEQSKQIAKAAGLKGNAAAEFVKNNRDKLPPITREQQKKLFENLYPDYEKRAIKNYDLHTKRLAGRKEWQSLDNRIRDVLIDFVYQGFTKGPRPMIAGMTNDKNSLIKYLEQSEVMQSYENNRQRIRYLQNE
ncbi:type VI secretion system secreted protein VgrG [Pseudomonas psychrotolerans]|nr:type VI secretion system secreted protein VgrG [Pseudomonas psychrotolerans]